MNQITGFSGIPDREKIKSLTQSNACSRVETGIGLVSCSVQKLVFNRNCAFMDFYFFLQGTFMEKRGVFGDDFFNKVCFIAKKH